MSLKVPLVHEGWNLASRGHYRASATAVNSFLKRRAFG